MGLPYDVLHAEKLRRTIKAVHDPGQIDIALVPSTYQLLTEALSGSHDDQMLEIEEATQERDNRRWRRPP
ncbi:hypothetical protein [Kocuria rosea]|uniref:hypothetical protein n=1 Tax=Kocuria rosea TaxID=1275 RepID=UPI002B2544D6|nr:hypothetical protein [Kocuria rosea]MEB2619993.1 hypothetical protein [Kocuria rosea]